MNSVKSIRAEKSREIIKKWHEVFDLYIDDDDNWDSEHSYDEFDLHEYNHNDIPKHSPLTRKRCIGHEVAEHVVSLVRLRHTLNSRPVNTLPSNTLPSNTLPSNTLPSNTIYRRIPCVSRLRNMVVQSRYTIYGNNIWNSLK
jgi:hypothetical protein